MEEGTEAWGGGSGKERRDPRAAAAPVGVIGQKGRDLISTVKITPDPVTVTRLLLGAKGK